MQCKDFIGKPSGNPRKNFLQRGQVIILYALLIPLMFLFVGLGIDLGWYYLNVSRLQNAADAAALAGASELVVKSEVTDIKTISLVDKYDDNPADIDTIDGDTVAAQYARENLSSDALSVPLTDDDGNITAYTLHDNWSIGGNSTVTMTTEIFKDAEENFYYVVHLAETVRHFMMPGWFENMDAPVVSIALLSKSGVIPTGPTEELTDKKIILDSNATDATLTDENGHANQRQRNVKVAVKTDNSGYENTSLPTTSNINLYRDRYTFIGWNTKADGTGIAYGNGRTFTSDELKALLGGNDTVTLYAQWEQKIIYIAGDSIYNAMKGNVTNGTKGLEELMTYNTWYALYKLGKDDAYSVYPDGGGSVYNGGLFRTETTNINSSVTSSKADNFSIFFDLGSDLMYHSGTLGNGLFKYSWDVTDIPNYSSTLASILAKKNSNVSNNPNIEYNFTNNTNLPKADAVKYRAHTIFNLDSVWEVRTNKTTSEKYTAYYQGNGESVPAVPDTDPLYVRIEGEELNEADGDRQNTTVRQMFINVNVDNTKSATTTTTKKFSQSDGYREVTLGSASGTKYLAQVKGIWSEPSIANRVYVNGSYSYNYYGWTYYYKIEDGPYADYTVSGNNYYVTETETSAPRPMIIFYEGPDRGLTEGVDDTERSNQQSGSPKSAYPNLSWRDSQPVILNLNADFNGILFAPNSPVAINGNGHNLHGFVVAKEFVRVTTASDYTVSNGRYFDGDGKEWFSSTDANGNTVFVDQYGNVDTRPLDSDATRPLGANETLAGVPEDDAINQYKAQHSDMEVVYKLNAFNLGSDSYYDSFDIPELKRNVYTYEDNYTNASKTNSVDMFFTTVRSRWIT